MALVIKKKPIKITTTKNTNFFRKGSGPINLFWEGGLVFFKIVFYCLKILFEEMGGTMALAGPPLPLVSAPKL
jgi:hypothetical protein